MASLKRHCAGLGWILPQHIEPGESPMSDRHAMDESGNLSDARNPQSHDGIARRSVLRLLAGAPLLPVGTSLMGGLFAATGARAEVGPAVKSVEFIGMP